MPLCYNEHTCMVPWTFSLDSRDGLADFIEYHTCLLAGGSPHQEAVFFDEESLSHVEKETLLVRARTVGRESWPMRQVLKAFVAGPGILAERQALVRSVRPTTAILLARVGTLVPEASLEGILSHPQARFAFHEPEQTEIEMLLPEIWLALWQEHAPTLRHGQRPFEREIASFAHRMQEERSHETTEERRQALQAIEDLVFLRGERVNIELMNQQSC